MAYGYGRNSGISWFRDYGDALHKYEHTIDIRGRTVEPKRPLGHRKLTDTYSIVKLDNGAIQCVLWKTPVVTFFPDSSVELTDGSWTSLSTCHFIGEVLNIDARVFNGSICVSLAGSEYRLPKTKIFKIVRSEDGHWIPVNAEKSTIHHINRAGSNNVRKRYKDFYAYLENVLKLRMGEEGIIFGNKEYGEAFGFDSQGGANLLGDVSRPYYENFLPTMNKLAYLLGDTNEDTKHLSYYHALLILARGQGYPAWKIDGIKLDQHQAKDLPNFVREILLGIHREECFSEIELPDGEVKLDRYARYYKSGWQSFHQGT
jgi:hypothetical protein